MINFDLIKKHKHRNINQILDYVLIFLPQKSKVLNLYLRTSCHALVVHLSIGLELFFFLDLDSDCFLSPDFHPRSCVQLSSLLCSPGERGLSEMITFESLLFHPQLIHNILCWEGGQFLDQALVQWVQNHGLCHPVFLDCSEKYVVICLLGALHVMIYFYYATLVSKQLLQIAATPSMQCTQST